MDHQVLLFYVVRGMVLMRVIWIIVPCVYVCARVRVCDVRVCDVRVYTIPNTVRSVHTFFEDIRKTTNKYT